MDQLGYEIEQALRCARAENDAVVQLDLLRTGSHVPILVDTERQHDLFSGATPTDNVAVGALKRGGIHLNGCLRGLCCCPFRLCATLVLTAAAEQRWRYGMSGGAVNWSFRVRKGQCLVHVFSNLIVRAFYGPIEARHQLSMQQSRTLLTRAQHAGATALAGPFSPCA